jgi:hypothetical protein
MLHIDVPTLAEVKTLAQARDAASVSIYMPTSTLPTDSRANRVAFEDLAKEALKQLGELGIDKRRTHAMEEYFAHLAGSTLKTTDDHKFTYKEHRPHQMADDIWRAQAPGLALLATPERMRTYRLSFAPTQQVEVADRFHLKPLIKSLTSPLDIVVLALSEKGVRLIHAFVSLPPMRLHVAGLPKDLAEATRRPDSASYPHGLRGKEEKKLLRYKFAQKVDRAVRAALFAQNKPLVLAADEPMASVFKSVNSYPHLVDEVIPGDQLETTDAQLADAALPILDKLYRKELNQVLARYAELFPRRATTDPSYAAHAATAGAIETLLVDLERIIPGFVSDQDGSVRYAASDTPEVYDVVDEVAKRALLTDARVLAAGREDLPKQAPLVAILRYQFGVARELSPDDTLDVGQN